ncbi:hypothetical protein CVS40_11770 [Lucilia cuprina]|nr:hypothetical protein CVS40_11770 [Lucilia cuprina]
MSFTFLQWNIHGLLNNFQELQLLIKDMDPCFISLQETHCAHNFTPIPPKNYNGYFVNSVLNSTSKQGTGIFIKSNIPHRQTVDSHLASLANENADLAAKYASSAPVIMDAITEKIDIRRYIANHVKNKQQETRLQHSHYSNVNLNNKPPKYPISMERDKIRVFSRLRLGHASFSHEWILRSINTAPNCNTCNRRFTICHVLDECQLFASQRTRLFQNNPAIVFLREPSTQNIDKIYDFIKLTKLKV